MSIFSKIFGNGKDVPNAVPARLLNDYINMYTPWNGEIYDDTTVRDCIDTIARHFSKLKPRHIMKRDEKISRTVDSNINYLLGTQPNVLMSSSEFLEKIVAQYYIHNNVFIYPQYDHKGNLVAIWPLDFTLLELLEYNNDLYVRFSFGYGERTTVPYADVIHIRRHFNDTGIFGDDNNQPMREDLTVLKSVKTAIINAVSNFGALRGILHWKSTIRPDDEHAAWQRFVDSYATSKNGSGIGSLDNKADFQQINTPIVTFDAAQMEYARNNIYRHFGLSENIIIGDYTEDQFIAFYESVIESLAVKLGQALTVGLFTSRERGYGNEVIIESNRLSYMSVQSKIKVCQALTPIGCISINEVREMFGYAGVEGGDERQISLNYVSATNQSQYQVGTDTSTEGGESDGTGETIRDDNTAE